MPPALVGITQPGMGFPGTMELGPGVDGVEASGGSPEGKDGGCC